MTKKQKTKTKEITKQITKAYKKKPKIIISLFILIFLLIILGGIYLYINGYLDDYLFASKEQNWEYAVFEQTDDGFYYYNEEGYEVGDYYYSIKDLVGDALANELNIILNQTYTPVSYGDARYVLSFSDRDPQNNNESVRGIYDNDAISTTWIGTGEGAWQREHVWPNSKLGIPRVSASSKNQGSDLHNLRAITSINQVRSNRYFDDAKGSAKTLGTEAFYPGDDHKGDVARILLYMSIMYDDLTLTNDVSKLINNNETNYTLEGAYSGLFDLLIKWHKEDPVDKFEFQRNQFIYNGVATDPNGKAITPQGNRNPFIDKPELVHLIWEEKTIEELQKPTENSLLMFVFIERLTFIVETKQNKWS